MARSEKNRHDSAYENRAYVSSASKIIGNLFFQNAARIDGIVEGDIVAADELIVGDTAEIAARIQAPSVIVSGTVKGEIKASKRIEIRAPAKVVGTLTSPILVVQPGALVEGHCAMPSPEAVSEEHRQPEPRLIVLDELADQEEEPAEQSEEEQEPSQQGISFFITKRQRADLLARGYDDAAIDKMTPGDAHRILGLI